MVHPLVTGLENTGRTSSRMTQRTGKRNTDPYSESEKKDYMTFQVKYVF